MGNILWNSCHYAITIHEVSKRLLDAALLISLLDFGLYENKKDEEILSKTVCDVYIRRHDRYSQGFPSTCLTSGKCKCIPSLSFKPWAAMWHNSNHWGTNRSQRGASGKVFFIYLFVYVCLCVYFCTSECAFAWICTYVWVHSQPCACVGQRLHQMSSFIILYPF